MRAVVIAAFISLVIPTSSRAADAGAIQVVHGRCVACMWDLQLGRIQFANPKIGWATAFVIAVTSGHVSQNSVVVHTEDGGRTWRRVKGVETYGVGMEPAFWLLDAKSGWIGCAPEDVEEADHLLRTIDGGRTWRRFRWRSIGTPIHLQFFDRRSGVGAESTADGPRFFRTDDGGKTWSHRPIPLDYPDVLFFSTPSNGWIGGNSREDRDRPRLLYTTDGGQQWTEAVLPDNARGRPFDISFVDGKHGWLIVFEGKQTDMLLKSDDGGRTWSSIRTGDLHAVRFITPEEGVVSDGASALVTRDGGQTWQSLALPGRVQSCEVVGREIWCSSGMDIVRVSIPRN